MNPTLKSTPTTGMSAKELHEIGSETVRGLIDGKIKPQVAHEILNGLGKLTGHCKNELKAIQMGFDIPVHLFGITKAQSTALRKPKRK